MSKHTTALLSSLRRSFYKPLQSLNACSSLHRKFSDLHASRETDSCGLPKQRTWSMNELLTSYPSPKLSPGTIARLHELSALVCPKEETLQFQRVKEELEEMVRLVEAVRLIDTSGVSVKGRGEEGDADRHTFDTEHLSESGQALLKHASRTQEGFYIVDSERRR